MIVTDICMESCMRQFSLDGGENNIFVSLSIMFFLFFNVKSYTAEMPHPIQLDKYSIV